MKEARDLEFKEMLSNSFLKTVSAFANYGEGRILFGIDDNGNVVGMENPQQACLDLENKINDSITPCPNYTLEIDSKKGWTSLICTRVKLIDAMIQQP